MNWKSEGKQIELNINNIKTKYMKISNKQNIGLLQELTVNEFLLQQVLEFTYLGSSLNCNNKIDKQINIRIMMDNRAYFSHLKLFKSNILSKRMKMILYKTFVRTIVTYGIKT